MSQTTTNSTTKTLGAVSALPAPTNVLENLAIRVRPAGLCLMLMRPDGTVAYHDSAAGTFFLRYVVPLIQYPQPTEGGLREKLGEVTANSAAVVWNTLPGVVVAGLPFVERRQMTGVLLLIAKDTSFELGEDVLRICSRLGLDGEWLSQQANQLPAYSQEAMFCQSQILVTMVRDQARLAGMETELTNLSGQLANTYEELSLIYQISGGMRINRRPAVFFKQACLDAIEVMNVRGLGVALVHATEIGQEPVLYGPLSLPPGRVPRLASELLALMRQRKAPLLINRLANDPKFAWVGEHAQRLLAVPLQRGEEILGVLFALDKEAGDFDSVDSKLLNSIANESAIYLENAVLFEDAHGLMMGLMHSLTSAVDAKDAYTCGHSERVAMVSKMLSQEAGLNEHDVERIYMAGLLHDVGKIGVPEAVLHKPGRLTAEEFEQMKRHPVIGAHILQDVKQIKDIIPGVLHHHERFDGKGYPSGLAGRDIPLMGRIICLADCFDAMTTTRTYRQAMPLEAALADIRRCAGTQFDPGLTESFLNIGTDRLREVLRHQKSSKQQDATVPVLSQAIVKAVDKKAA
jgi:HD-GYP domain-containing protein (c-di-GMP phosphodiesterase class II)